MSGWAFGFNRQIDSVCSVAINFDFQESTTDRCSLQPTTDEFGFSFVGSVSPNRPKSTEKKKNLNGEFKNATTEPQGLHTSHARPVGPTPSWMRRAYMCRLPLDVRPPRRRRHARPCPLAQLACAAALPCSQLACAAA